MNFCVVLVKVDFDHNKANLGWNVINSKWFVYFFVTMCVAHKLQKKNYICPLTSWKKCLICACLVLNLLIFWWILLSFSSCPRVAHSQCKYELETRMCSPRCIVIKPHTQSKGCILLVKVGRLTSSCILQRIPPEWYTGLGTPTRNVLLLLFCFFYNKFSTKVENYKCNREQEIHKRILLSLSRAGKVFYPQWQHLLHLGFPAQINQCDISMKSNALNNPFFSRVSKGNDSTHHKELHARQSVTM